MRLFYAPQDRGLNWLITKMSTAFFFFKQWYPNNISFDKRNSAATPTGPKKDGTEAGSPASVSALLSQS